MLCSSKSSSFSSADGSELNSGKNSEILGDSGASFVPNDEPLEPLATQIEEAAAYEANMALEAKRKLEFQRRFTGEVGVRT